MRQVGNSGTFGQRWHEAVTDH